MDEEEEEEDEVDDEGVEEVGVEGVEEVFEEPAVSDWLELLVAAASPFAAVVVLVLSLVSFFSAVPSFFSEFSLPVASSFPGGFNLSE